MPYTLTVNFTLASPDPGSYRVKFWPTSNPSSITTRLVSNSPFIESNLPETSYAGTIEASCGGGNYSTPVLFSGTPTTDSLYLTATEYIVGSQKDLRWVLSETVGTTSSTDPSARTVPFDIKLAYNLVGTNILNTGSSSSTITGLVLLAGNKSVSQGTLSDDITSINTINIYFKESGAGSWGSPIAVTGPTGSNLTNPVTYVNLSTGITYELIITVNSLAVNFYT